MSGKPDFLPSRDLRHLKTLDLASTECLDTVRSNLESLALVLGASGGQIIHARPHLQESLQQSETTNLPSFEQPPREVDSFERSYVTRWLTRLVSEFTMTSSDDEVTAAQADALSERCAELLALSAGRMAAGASVQDHVFQLDDGALAVKLRDGALVHDSLGTHTWGAAPILSQLILPLDAKFVGHDIKALELGAGTGLVGLAIALWSRQHRAEQNTQVICTDYHPTVLENLAHNIALNVCASSDADRTTQPAFQTSAVSVVARCLDWQSVHRSQSGQGSGLAEELTSQTLPKDLVASNGSDWATVLDVEAHAGTFDLIVAADCVYDPVHPSWIRSVAEKLLRQSNPPSDSKALLHIMVPLRPTHQQEMQAVYQAFEPNQDLHRSQLVVLSEKDYHGYENFGAWNAVVRSDDASQSQPEGGLARTYRWFQIGWQTLDS
ncbi:uncharacterized protein UTRI_00971_B [Ustilago trichophora]|uniref:S-adenosylmethionine-dependent methyltransferase of the seven beta-strand family n=1 Tax=Ustilago trichophora TaxID=86804 RepID=A0A5C3DST1_9BASI|nr:uncharacterized protein UTRI_00971_B [Ustilago trichophora]